MNLYENQRWNQVLRKGKHFLLHMRHLSWCPLCRINEWNVLMTTISWPKDIISHYELIKHMLFVISLNLFRHFSWNWIVINQILGLKMLYDFYLEHDSNGTLTTKHYDKRDNFNFPIANYPFLYSNIPSSPAYGVYMSQLIRYSKPVILIRISTSICPVNKEAFQSRFYRN